MQLDLTGKRSESRKQMELTQASSAGSQEYIGDPRNDDVLISVNGALTPL